MTHLDPDPAASCSSIRILLSGSLDGELDAPTERSVEDHLAICESCGAHMQEIRAISRALATSGRQVPAPPEWQQIAHRLTMRRVPRRLRILSRPSFLLAAAAAAVLLGILGSVALHARQRSSPMPAMGGAAGILPAGFVRQLVDPTRQPDFSSLGAARAVASGRLHEVHAQVSFTPLAPETLPDGYRLEDAWVINSETCRMVCLRYRREGRILAILQSACGASRICDPKSNQCCLMSGLACRRSRIDQVDLVQTIKGGLALAVATPAGGTDLDALMASLSGDRATVRD